MKYKVLWIVLVQNTILSHNYKVVDSKEAAEALKKELEASAELIGISTITHAAIQEITNG